MYRTVIIGAGNIAAGFDFPESEKVLTHAHAVTRHPDLELAGFFDRDRKKAEKAAGIWKGKAFLSLGEALSDVDIVICCVPDECHVPVLKEIAKYKPKLVICEKPLAVSVDDAEQIYRRYRQNIPLAVNYSRRFLNEIRLLKEEMRSYGNFLKGVGYYGKGLLHNGSHMVDLLRFFLGEVSAWNILAPGFCDYQQSDLSKDLLLEIAQGEFYMMAVDCRAVTVFELEFLFEKARVRILDSGEKIEVYHVMNSDIYAGYKNYKLTETRMVDYSGALTGLTDNAVNFLKGKENLYCTAGDALADLRICVT